MYFNKNQEKYQFELSQKACLKWGIKKDSYYAAIEELEMKGYLHPFGEGSNHFLFYETPQSENPTMTSEKESQASDFPRQYSDFPERNNTYTTSNNTEIKQNITREIKQTSFADGKRCGCGKAATIEESEIIPWEKLTYAQQKQVLKELGF